MNLIGFHRVLITIAIIFCGGYAIWEFRRYLAGGETNSLLIAIAFAVGTLALAYYLRHLTRILHLDADANRSQGPFRP